MGTNSFTLWPWLWSLTDFFKTLTLLITCKQWVLELWYFTPVFLVTRPSRGYQHFWPCILDLVVWPIFENFNLANNIWTVSARTLIFHMSNPCDPSVGTNVIDLWPWNLAYFLKNLTLLITFQQWVPEFSYSSCWYKTFWPWHLIFKKETLFITK